MISSGSPEVESMIASNASYLLKAGALCMTVQFQEFPLCTPMHMRLPCCVQNSVTRSNRHGGMLGGITSGMPIVLRAAVKPTSSLPKEQDTVTTSGESATIRTKGRHDPCLLPRFIPMAEAMVAIVLADHWLRWQAQRGSVSW